MNLSGLQAALTALPRIQELLTALQNANRTQGLACGLLRAARPALIAALAEATQRPMLLITARTEQATTLAEELPAWTPSTPIVPFPEPNALFYEVEAWTSTTIQSRIHALNRLAAPQAGAQAIYIACARALMTRTLPKRDFMAHTRTLRAGQPLRLAKLLEDWVGAGYTAESLVVQPGQFSQRGGLLDIFPLGANQPVRVELFGDEVDTLRLFDPASQRSGAKIEQVIIPPAREALAKFKRWALAEAAAAAPASGGTSLAHLGEADLTPDIWPDALLEFQLPLMFPPASLIEYLPPNTLVVIDDWHELVDTVHEFEQQALELREEQIQAGVIMPDFPPPYLAWAELQDELAAHHFVPTLLAQAPDATWQALEIGEPFRPGPRYGGQLKPLLGYFDTQLEADAAIVVISRQAQRLAELWGERRTYTPPVSDVVQLPAAGDLVFVQGALAEGWKLDLAAQVLPAKLGLLQGLQLFTDTEIFGWSRPEHRRRAALPSPATPPEARYADLAPGDYVVHVDFGVGRFRELVHRTVEGLEREYLMVEYAEGDELYVPIHQTDRLTRYVGVDDKPPTLSRLGTADWSTTKTKAQQATLEVAKDLLELYAKREATPGFSFSTDTAWQRELEASFPYVETEDQLRAIREVKTDMERARPMDRLICGDVGYGKTEVALRAAFKAVMAGCQVAVLVPTTVLAQQHLHTFQNRLAPYPVQVEMLSRFRSPAEVREILEKLAEGQIDILIGTHRLLQKDVQFKSLGLLIIDEEQRFGVTHKEHLKKLRTEVDVLTLTATPIPRTLYLSLTGVRDISTINTPPEERLPIITHIGPYNPAMARQAILRELDRDGQVFYVHNRVQSINIIRNQLTQLVPEARIGVAHGQMAEHELSQVMEQFAAGEVDVLLCTSIIESGLDIPNANTLMVERADTFGLAQLYQLRGRVGRAAARAYAYFFTDTRHRPTVEGRERLETLAEQTDLGAGYNIAMRDLEMRGAGDILGVRQHGQIAAVGFHLYTRLLAEAVRQVKQTQPNEAAPTTNLLEAPSYTLELNVSVDLPLSSSIPAAYVPDQQLRLRLYRRLADLREVTDLDNMAQELHDRFGPLPRPLESLLYQLRVKLWAQRAEVSAVGSENGQIVITLLPNEDNVYRTASLPAEVRVSKHRIWLPKPTETNKEGWRTQLLRILQMLAAENAKLASRLKQ